MDQPQRSQHNLKTSIEILFKEFLQVEGGNRVSRFNMTTLANEIFKIVEAVKQNGNK